MLNQDIDIIKNEIAEGLLQVDSSFVIDDFECNFNKTERKLTVTFTAHNSEGETVEVNDLWQD